MKNLNGMKRRWPMAQFPDSVRTVAEAVVWVYFDDSPDGQEWPEGFADELDFMAVCPAYHVGNSNSMKWLFSDGSAIIDSNGAWDYGYTDAECSCWASQPHHCEEG